LAALNPCGFAMLPAYLGLLVAGDDKDRLGGLLRAFRVTLAMTMGFLLVFGIFGLVVLPISSEVEAYLPWVSVLLGSMLIIAGGWLIAGRTLPTLSLPGVRWALRPTWRSMVLFGVGYALASLSCTIAPFLALVVLAFREGSVASGLVLFLLYAVGMALVVGTTAVSVSLARTTLAGRLRGLGRYVPRLSGVLLLLSGLYSLYYGIWELRVLSGGSAVDPIVAIAEQVQSALTRVVRTLGGAGVAALLGGLVWLLFTIARLRTRAGTEKEIRR
jgi:cytochrome c biogenesis protein CcdA